MLNFPSEKDPILQAAGLLQPGAIPVLHNGGDSDFAAIAAEVGFDPQRLGAQMLVEGARVDISLNRLNELWADARTQSSQELR